jgi:hypothetical protein
MNADTRRSEILNQHGSFLSASIGVHLRLIMLRCLRVKLFLFRFFFGIDPIDRCFVVGGVDDQHVGTQV